MDGGSLRVGSVSEQRVERLVLGLTDCVTVQQLTDHVLFRTVSCRLRHNVHRLRIQPVYTYDTIRYDTTGYFSVRSKADTSQPLIYCTQPTTKKVGKQKKVKSKKNGYAQKCR